MVEKNVLLIPSFSLVLRNFVENTAQHSVVFGFIPEPTWANTRSKDLIYIQN